MDHLCLARELELRALRKTVTECEEQNATLQKHVEQMQTEIERMEHEMRQQKLQNEMLSQNLNRLRSVLASSFASLPLPGTHESPNVHTIDKYMNEVKAMQEANSVHFAPFLNRVKDIISRLELWFSYLRSCDLFYALLIEWECETLV